MKLNEGKCIGCGLCASTYPNVFEMKDSKARVKADTTERLEGFECPVGAIKQ